LRLQRTHDEKAIRLLDRRVLEYHITLGELLPSPIGSLDCEGVVCCIFGGEGDDLVGALVEDCGPDLEAEPPESFPSPFAANTLVALLIRGLWPISPDRLWMRSPTTQER
jgi:hypothetical protein